MHSKHFANNFRIIEIKLRTVSELCYCTLLIKDLVELIKNEPFDKEFRFSVIRGNGFCALLKLLSSLQNSFKSTRRVRYDQRVLEVSLVRYSTSDCVKRVGSFFIKLWLAEFSTFRLETGVFPIESCILDRWYFHVFLDVSTKITFKGMHQNFLTRLNIFHTVLIISIFIDTNERKFR